MRHLFMRSKKCVRCGSVEMPNLQPSTVLTIQEHTSRYNESLPAFLACMQVCV